MQMGETVKGSRQTRKRQIRNEIPQCHYRKPLRPLHMHSLEIDNDMRPLRRAMNVSQMKRTIRVITKLPNSEQSYKGKVKTHKYINRQNQSTTGKL